MLARWLGVLTGGMLASGLSVVRLAVVCGCLSGPSLHAAEQPAADANQAQFEAWQKEAAAALAAIDAAGPNAALPEGITPSRAATRRRVLEQMDLGIRRFLKSRESAVEIRAGLKQARDNASTWAGFTELPPYPIMLLDDLLNERDAAAEKMATLVSTRNLLERSKSQIEEQVEKEDREMADAVRSAGAEPDATGRWQIDAERADRRLLSVRAATLQLQLVILGEQVDTVRAEQALLDRKIAAVGDKVKFGEEELAVIAKAAADRRSALRKELAALRKQYPSLEAARDQARAAMQKVEKEEAAKAEARKAAAEANPESAPAPATPPAEPTPEQLAAAEKAAAEAAAVELVRLRLEAAEARLDSLPIVIDSLESLEQLETALPEAYEIRKSLIDAKGRVERKAAMEKLTDLQSRLGAWQVFVENRIREVGADLKREESRAGVIATADPRYLPIAEKRTAYSDRQAAFQRIEQSVARQRQLVDRWLADANPKNTSSGWLASLSHAVGMVGDWLRGVWSFEVMKLDDTVEIDGQQLTVKRGVTLGVLIGAILFFIIAYIAAAWISKKAQNRLVQRGRIADAQARTLRNWLMILVGVVLALTTLHLLKIPLTVFAFFGGALAIGLGFGMQTLIKNFISGIILLFERKVRVGDIVDVGGLAGTVVEINTRSSVVRGFDGVEALIPNSEFLETRVVNWTLSSRKVRREVIVGVSYGTSPQVVIELLLEVATRHGLVLKDPAPQAMFSDFGDNSLMFTLHFWMELAGKTNSLTVMSDLRIMIEKRLTEQGIGVPYPQRDIHLSTSEPLRVSMVSEAPPDKQP